MIRSMRADPVDVGRCEDVDKAYLDFALPAGVAFACLRHGSLISTPIAFACSLSSRCATHSCMLEAGYRLSHRPKMVPLAKFPA